jgi:predicted HicB family RNase H-like nuclease
MTYFSHNLVQDNQRHQSIMTQDQSETVEVEAIKAFTVRIRESLWEEAAILAVRERTSLNEMVTSALEQRVAAAKQQKRKVV